MPKGFSDRERDIIRDKLLARGRERLKTHGIRKTSVEDLTRAAGISKGAFYQFFPSKEALFFQVLEQAEAQMRERVFGFIQEAGQGARQNFLRVMRNTLAAWEAEALLRNFSQDDFEYLRRKLPEAEVQAHLSRDNAFVAQVVERWRRDGVRFRRDPHVIAGLMKALFFVSLHRDDLGPKAYPATMDLLLELAANDLIEE
jgi:AcrR family transcriptional regulator